MITYSNVMKMYQVVIKMAFLVFKKFNIPNFQHKQLKFLETIIEVHFTKRETAVQNLNHICFAAWAVGKSSKVRVSLMSLASEKIDQLSVRSSLLLKIGLKVKIVCLKSDVLWNIPIWKIKYKLTFWNRQNQLFIRGNRGCSEIFRWWTALN